MIDWVKVAIYAAIAAFIFGLGWTGAWKIQGYRLTEFKQEQTRILQEAKDEQEKQRIESGVAYAAQQKALKDAIASGAVLRRCISSGKCDGLFNANSAGACIQTGSGANGTKPDAIPVGGISTPQVIQDCAITTLQLNSLQNAIEGQKGYK